MCNLRRRNLRVFLKLCRYVRNEENKDRDTSLKFDMIKQKKLLSHRMWQIFLNADRDKWKELFDVFCLYLFFADSTKKGNL